MKMIKIGWALFIGFIILSSCKKPIVKESNSILNSNPQIESNHKTAKDTVDVDEYNVLFFHPNEQEFEILLEKYGEGLNEVDSDFAFYANSVYDSISKTDWKVKITTEKVLKLTTSSRIKYIDRGKNDDGQYGVIFNMINCDPQIEFGVMSDLEMFQALNNYIKNCN